MKVTSPCLVCGELTEHSDKAPALCKRPGCIVERRRRQLEHKKNVSVTRMPQITIDSVQSDPRTKLPKSPIQGILEQATIIPCDPNGTPIVKDFDKRGELIRPLKPTEFHSPTNLCERCPKGHIDSFGTPYPAADCFTCKEESHSAKVRQELKDKPLHKDIKPPAAPETQPQPNESQKLIEAVTKFFGIPNRKSLPRRFQPARDPKLDWPSYREILGLTREQILDWLELPEVIHGCFPTITIELEKKWVKKVISNDVYFTNLRNIQALEQEKSELEQQLFEVKNKTRDDGLSSQKRAAIVKKLPKTIHDLRQQIACLKRRKIEPEIIQWVSEIVPGTQHEVMHWERDPIPDDDIRCYREVVVLTRPWSDAWRVFENEVISRACATIFRPLRSTELPGLVIKSSRHNRNYFSDDMENNVVLKTQGDSIGGRIISAGQDPATGRTRGLSSFDLRPATYTVRTHSDDRGSDSPDYDPSDDTND